MKQVADLAELIDGGGCHLEDSSMTLRRPL